MENELRQVGAGGGDGVWLFVVRQGRVEAGGGVVACLFSAYREWSLCFGS